MRKIFLFFIVFLSVIANAQTRINYILQIRYPDKTEKKFSMNLDIQDDLVSFYDEELLKGMIKASKSNQLVFHHTKTKENHLIVFTFETQPFKIQSTNKINWELVNEFKQINQYKLQKATVTFGERKWTAWFCPEINIMEGPYNFRDLPGLIFELTDSENIFVYTLTGIEKFKKDTKKLNFDLDKTQNITWEKYNKLMTDFFENPFLKQRTQLSNGIELNVDDKDVKVQDLNKMTSDFQKSLKMTFPPAIELDNFSFYKYKILQ
ncbi:hypothetical protein ASG22_08805 [Chryseobacterium sp. Leaf405]|uniref:GLPGLI family protein n=1 Tax=Chryseobacterium sp. Leaf405 TaxID=1736367 RepID=UPI0006F8AC6E|nr:GLPGLI family protein [Chryseobacterium sp. Leaf405]KQT24106.1 hypothetical protein ASG22_08805 [Chryseobacterium sp. Leaf405]